MSLLAVLCAGCMAAEPASPEAAGLPVAPESARVDLDTPTFSDPTAVDNPWFPIRDLHAVVLLGNVDGLDFRTETTLLPDPVTITLDGRAIEALESQYVAFVGRAARRGRARLVRPGRRRNVWYLGEDVFNYADGVVADTEGTWVAGPDVAAGDDHAGRPRGRAGRSGPENAWPVVFEEVVIRGGRPHGPRTAGADSPRDPHP